MGALNATKITQLNQLRLLEEPDLIVNNILIDQADGKSLPVSQIDSSFADYYFDLLSDSQISDAFVCNLISNGDEDSYKFARKDFICPDDPQQYLINNPYSQKNTDSCGDNE